MKRKNVMKIGLIISIAAMMVFSTSITVMGSKMKNEQETDNCEIGIISSIKIGKAYLCGDPHDYNENDIYVNFYSLDEQDVGEGTDVDVQVDYEFHANGGRDRVYLYLRDADTYQEVSYKTTNDGDDFSGTLTLPDVQMRPDDSYKFQVKIVWKDDDSGWGYTPWVVYDTGYKSKTIDTMPGYPELSVPSEVERWNLPKVKGAISASFNVQNLGRGSIHFKVEQTSCPDSGSDYNIKITPDTGYASKDSPVTVELKWQNPSWKHNTNEWTFKVTNIDNPSEYKTVELTIDFETKAKSKAMPLYTVFQERFPLLFTLFQSLSVF